MKVYSIPDEVPFPDPDYSNYDVAKEIAREKRHMADLKAWLIAQGWNGKHTGGILEIGVADGYAQYMFADGPKSFLIHLPYGDKYDSRDVQFLPKKEVIKRLDARKKLHEIFAKHRTKELA